MKHHPGGKKREKQRGGGAAATPPPPPPPPSPAGARGGGERVVAMMLKGGGYAEKAALPAAHAIPIPPAMSVEEAAALPVNYLTAYQAFTYMVHLRAGECVLIHAAAGGVGLAAIQLA